MRRKNVVTKFVARRSAQLKAERPELEYLDEFERRLIDAMRRTDKAMRGAMLDILATLAAQHPAKIGRLPGA